MMDHLMAVRQSRWCDHKGQLRLRELFWDLTPWKWGLPKEGDQLEEEISRKHNWRHELLRLQNTHGVFSSQSFLCPFLKMFSATVLPPGRTSPNGVPVKKGLGGLTASIMIALIITALTYNLYNLSNWDDKRRWLRLVFQWRTSSIYIDLQNGDECAFIFNESPILGCLVNLCKHVMYIGSV